MPQAPTKRAKSEKSKKQQSDGGDAGPSAQERVGSGVKLAEHLQTVMTGGKIRQAFALWGAAKQLRVAAAGAGGVVKKYPLTAALIGGGLAATAIYLAAKSAGAEDEASGGEEDESGRDEAEDQMADDDAGEEQDEEEGEGEDEADEEEEAPARSSRNGARQRSGSRGR